MRLTGEGGGGSVDPRPRAGAGAGLDRRVRVRELKHRWSLANNYLCGVTAGTWWRILRQNGFAVDPAYAHRAALVTAASLMNSLWRPLETRRFGARVAATEIREPPLFILGHWRSGTTLLHELMARDVDQFAYPNLYQVINPLTFLSTETLSAPIFRRLLPDKRPMDNILVRAHSPQEDEFAPALATGLSPYFAISFPRAEEHYEQHFTFEGVAEEETAAWDAALVEFARKLTFRNEGRALLLKSPPHTARIGRLMRLFPGARFIHIHRNPYDVFRSGRHYFDSAAWYTYLQRPACREAVSENILRRYGLVHEAYFAQRDLVPEDRFCEVRFEDLERDPAGEVRRVYERLGLGGFDRFEPALTGYVESINSYQKNRHGALEEPWKSRVARACARSFETWGYRP